MKRLRPRRLPGASCPSCSWTLKESPRPRHRRRLPCPGAHRVLGSRCMPARVRRRRPRRRAARAPLLRRQAPTALVTRQSRSAKRCVCVSRRPRRRPLRHASAPFAHWYVAATRRKRPHLAAAARRDQRCCLGSPRSERRRRGRRRGAGLAPALWRHELRAGGPHSRLCGGGVAGGGVCVTTV